MPRQHSLVFVYGDKPKPLAQLIQLCQTRLSAALGTTFRPYPQSQIHATLISLERLPGTRLTNANLADFRGIRAEMDIAGYLQLLRATPKLPVAIQLGGFEDRDYPFRSRGKPPYARSLVIARDKVVLMGWPVERDGEQMRYPPILEELRRAALAFNILHSYHRAPTDFDNDFYMRLGTLSSPIEPNVQRAIEADLQRELSRTDPQVLQLGLEQLFVVAYTDDRLSPTAARAAPITDLSVLDGLLD